MSFRWIGPALLLALLPCLRAAADEPTLPAPRPAPKAGPPEWLPRYDLDIQLDLTGHVVHVHQRVTWINRHQRQAAEVVFNAHSHYKVPDGEIGLMAKTLEILRMSPGEAIDAEGHSLEITKVRLGDAELPFHYAAKSQGDPEDNDTALVVPLPHPIAQGESVTLDLDFDFHLPQKQGRWGQWRGVTALSNWLPVLAYYDDKGWQPTPFIPWHQPFFNESGHYSARVTLPCDQKFVSSGTVVASRELGDGRRQVEIAAPAVRDFAFLCSARYVEHTAVADGIRVRCLAFPEHEFHAQLMLRTVCDCLPVYNRWFGRYPYPEYSFVEAYFGWNGNECSNLVMIDERIFDAPHIACGFVEYLIAHETCHQWWYNVVGTNGYCETWMDEGLVTHLSHRYIDEKHGRNSPLMQFPGGLEWLPNIYRDDYRVYGLLGTIGRGDAGPTVQPMPGFGHLVNLLSMCYDKGSQVTGMIERRLGPTAFLDFLRLVYQRYQFRILRVADFQRELEEYTHQSWQPFFDNWLYGGGLCDWCVEQVDVDGPRPPVFDALPRFGKRRARARGEPCRVTVILHQKAQINEATVLGFCLDGGDGYQVRLPIEPGHALQLDDPPARIVPLPDNRVRVEVLLPGRPTQIAVDPDNVLLDCDRVNNYWKTPIRWRLTPLNCFIEETDLTCAYDKWNVILGPYVGFATTDDPWFNRSSLFGVRAAAYRTQRFDGGVYAGFRPDERDLAAGVDGIWHHWPYSHTEVGFNVEGSLTRFTDNGTEADRAVLFARYIFLYGSSLYLPPAHYVELFGALREDPLPWPAQMTPDGERFNHQTTAGLHYRLDYLTPYWDPEGGIRFDATYAEGIPIFAEKEAFHAVSGQFSLVKGLPDGLGWLSETRLAGRVYGAAALPTKGELFSQGGSELFRGFDLSQRQGSLLWVASAEWRLPLAKNRPWDCCDHVVGLRNIWLAPFYDVGDTYLNSRSLGPVAHALGVGLRLDVNWFGFVERTLFRVDVAKTLNVKAPTQVWLGLGVPF